MSRRHARRRKGTSLALTGAMVAGPAAPMALAAETPAPGSAQSTAASHGSEKLSPVLLKQGSRGHAVVAVQEALNRDLSGRTIAVDGVYGPATTQSVLIFQALKGLPRSGMVDTATWAALFGGSVRTISAGSAEAKKIEASAGTTEAAVTGGDVPHRDTQASASVPAAGHPEGSGSARSVREVGSPAAGSGIVVASARSATGTASGASAAAGASTAPAASSGAGPEAPPVRQDGVLASAGGAQVTGGSGTPSEPAGSTAGQSVGNTGQTTGGTTDNGDGTTDPGTTGTTGGGTASGGNTTGGTTGGGSTGGGSTGGVCSDHLIQPVSGYTVTGRFGDPRSGHRHSGIDLAVPEGTPIHAAACGRVTLTQSPGQSGGYGNFVCIQNTSQLSTCYAHMESYSRVGVGEWVYAGQVIGYVGQTGDATGPHVHFETRIGSSTNPYSDTPVDPAPYLNGRTLPGTPEQAPASARAQSSQRATAPSASQPSSSASPASTESTGRSASGSQSSSTGAGDSSGSPDPSGSTGSTSGDRATSGSSGSSDTSTTSSDTTGSSTSGSGSRSAGASGGQSSSSPGPATSSGSTDPSGAAGSSGSTSSTSSTGSSGDTSSTGAASGDQSSSTGATSPSSASPATSGTAAQQPHTSGTASSSSTSSSSSGSSTSSGSSSGSQGG